MSAVLIDTSVWGEHFRHRNTALEQLLHDDSALMHPMVIGEIACGTPLKPRAQTLAYLTLLPMILDAGLADTVAFIEREAMYGAGCGLVDMVLLASTLISPGAKLWTLDKRLKVLAERYGVGYRPAVG